MSSLTNIHLAKLSCYHYPRSDEENALLKEYFQHHNREFAKGSYIYLHRTANRSGSYFHSHQASIIEIYPYLVTKLEHKHIVDSQIYIEEIDRGISVIGSTSIFLDETFYISLLSPDEHVIECIRLLTSCHSNQINLISSSHDLSDICLLWKYSSFPVEGQVATKQYYHFKTRLINSGYDIFGQHDDTMMTISPNKSFVSPIQELPTVYKCSDNAFLIHHLNDSLRIPKYSSASATLPVIGLSAAIPWLQELYSVLEICYQSQSSMIGYLNSKVVTEFIQLDMDDSVAVSDVRTVLAAFSNKFKVPLIFLDARLLLVQTSTMHSISLFTNKAFEIPMINSYHPKSLAELEYLLLCLPSCMVVFEGVDNVLCYDQHAHNDGNSQEYVLRQQKFFSSIENLINESLSRRRNRSLSMVNICFIFPFKRKEMLVPRTKFLFSTHISVDVSLPPTSTSTNTHGDPVNKYGQCQLLFGTNLLAALQNLFTVDVSLLKNKTLIQPLTMVVRHLLHNSILESFKRHHSAEWLECFGYFRYPLEMTSDQCILIRKYDTMNAGHALVNSINLHKQLNCFGCFQRISPAISLISPIYWKDIGGMERVRKEILDILELPLRHPHLFPQGSPRRHGVLLYGPPGTGKTLIAKAVATECSMSFLSIKGPELLDSYVGESERNIREIFLKARDKSPCILFFDEIDSLAPRRAKGTDSGGGVMDRIVSQLLTEMDQLSEGRKCDDGVIREVFVIAATNRPDLLDPALLRPGRFDRRIYLGASGSVEVRTQILKAQTRKFIFEESVDLRRVAALLPDKVTGADIGAVCSTAYSKALERKLCQLKNQFHGDKRTSRSNGCVHNHYANDDDIWDMRNYMENLSSKDIAVQVSIEDFKFALSVLKPSVVDLTHYERLEKQFDSSQ